MSIASAEPDQHHGTRLITTYCSLIIFTDLPGMVADWVGHSFSSQVLSNHSRVFTLRGTVRVQEGENHLLQTERRFPSLSDAGLGLDMQRVG